ncbi:MAG: LptF/LptG family permease [Phycisphaerales bacterium]|nr:LptF/LptG family permease [Phycisphaerales bacterium]
MSILDRAIARQYLINVVALVVILFSFIVAIDVSLNVDRFVSVAQKLGPEDGLVRRAVVTISLVIDFWWPRLLQLFGYMLGMVLVAGMGFTVAQMVRHRELVAIMASGQSLHRVARPIIAVAIALTLVQAANQELIQPRIAHLLTRDHGDTGSRSLGTMPVELCRDGRGRLLYARSFDADAGQLGGVIIIVRNADGLAKEVIRAEEARWDGSAWVLANGVAESRETAGESHPVDRFETDLDPAALRMRRFKDYAQALSFRQTGEVLSRGNLLDERTRAEFTRLRWGRVSVWVSNLLALVVAMPFYLTRVPRNMMLQTLRCAPVAGLGLVGGVLGAGAGIPGVPAGLAVFVPVMILAPLAVAAATSVKT